MDNFKAGRNSKRSSYYFYIALSFSKRDKLMVVYYKKGLLLILIYI